MLVNQTDIRDILKESLLKFYWETFESLCIN